MNIPCMALTHYEHTMYNTYPLFIAYLLHYSSCIVCSSTICRMSSMHCMPIMHYMSATPYLVYFCTFTRHYASLYSIFRSTVTIQVLVRYACTTLLNWFKGDTYHACDFQITSRWFALYIFSIHFPSTYIKYSRKCLKINHPCNRVSIQKYNN